MKRRQLLQLLASSSLGYPLLSRAQTDVPALVHLIEQTPRDQLTEKIVVLIRQGLGRDALLWAIQLAGMRQIQPRPVGFKFHAVMMVDAARQLAQGDSGPGGWVPILWNLDYFKFSQQRNIAAGGWQLHSFNGAVPAADESMQLFTQGLQQRDELKVDAAAVAVSRQHGLHQLFEPLAHYAVRDFHSIGHKSIYLCHSWRQLQRAGGRQADWVCRALAYALIADGNVAAQDAHWTRLDYAANVRRAALLPLSALRAGTAPAVTGELVQLLGQASADECCDAVVGWLQQAPVQAVWDGIFLAAAERVLQQPTIPMLHCVTVSHAMAWLWRQSADSANRNLLLLQAVAYLARMREQRWAGQPAGVVLGDLVADPQPLSAAERRERIGQQLGQPGKQSQLQLMAYPYSTEGAALRNDLLRLLRRKSNQAHDFKYGAAVLEVMDWLSPSYWPVWLAATSVLLPGAMKPDSTEASQIEHWLATSEV